jgi:hypothetical protein
MSEPSPAYDLFNPPPMCVKCGAVLSSQEHACYGSRCENCWIESVPSNPAGRSTSIVRRAAERGYGPPPAR